MELSADVLNAAPDARGRLSRPCSWMQEKRLICRGPRRAIRGEEGAFACQRGGFCERERGGT